MGASVYKTRAGRDLVEGRYREILDSARGTGFAEAVVDSSAGPTHVLRFGDRGKPPLVALHGTMSNSAAWLGVAPALAEDFSVYCADIPGEPGLSEPVRLSLSSEEPVRWLESVLDSLSLSSCAFLGMSLGGWYALRFAARHPERVTALSMIAASGLAKARASFIFKALLCRMAGRAGREKLASLVYHKTEIGAEVLEYQALVSAHFNPLVEPVPVFTDEELAPLRFPIQYFGGEKDALLDSAKSADRLASLVPGAEVHVLPDTGHVILDRFPEVTEFLLRTARRLPPSGK